VDVSIRRTSTRCLRQRAVKSCERGLSVRFACCSAIKLPKSWKARESKKKHSRAFCSAFGMCTRAHDINFWSPLQLHFLATSVSLCLCMRLEGHLSHSPAATHYIARWRRVCVGRLNYSARRGDNRAHNAHTAHYWRLSVECHTRKRLHFHLRMLNGMRLFVQKRRQKRWLFSKRW
jgi:hypothetical protein